VFAGETPGIRPDFDWRTATLTLWRLLDDIDTCDDAARENDAAFRSMVRKYAQQRNLVLESLDGYTLSEPLFKTSSPEPAAAPEPEELQGVTLSHDELNYYQNSLVTWILRTRETGDPTNISSIRALWDDESWESIQEKLDCEASTWHVWWMDGVSRYAAIDKSAKAKDDAAALATIVEQGVRSVQEAMKGPRNVFQSSLGVIFRNVLREAARRGVLT
jgi:hypothetical protein